MLAMLKKKTDHFVILAHEQKIRVMHLTIRPAQQLDAAVVPEIMLQAMEDIIFRFIQKEDKKRSNTFFNRSFSTDRKSI